MSGVMMLNHLARSSGDSNLEAAASMLREAYSTAVAAGERTRDLGGTLGTDAFADAVVGRFPG